jgi:hypothetical protein
MQKERRFVKNGAKEQAWSGGGNMKLTNVPSDPETRIAWAKRAATALQ